MEAVKCVLSFNMGWRILVREKIY